MQTFRPFIPLLIFAVCGLLLALAAIQPLGPGVSGDAVEYLSAARSLIEDGQMRGSGGELYILWPPFYPLFLAAFERLSGQDAFAIGGGLNALLYALTIALGGWIAWRAGSPGTGWAVALALLLSPAMYAIGINILSDLLFIVLGLVFFVVAGRLLQSERPAEQRLLLLGLALLAGLAILTRYIGVTLLAVMLAVAWVARLRRPLTLAQALGLAALPLLTWLARNRLLYGSLFGPRGAPRWTLSENLGYLSEGLDLWFRPLGWGAVLLLLTGLALLALIVRLSAARRSDALPLRLRLSPYAWPALLFGALYLPALIASQMSTAITRIDQRLLAPLVFPLVLGVVLLAGWALRTLTGLLRSPTARGLKAALAALLLLAWLAPGAAEINQVMRRSRVEGVPVYNYLNTRAFHESPVTQYLLNHPLPRGAALYSNYAPVVFLFTGRRAGSSPFQHLPSNRETTFSPESYRGEWPAEEEAYLVWFNEGPHEHYMPPGDLATFTLLEPLFSSDAGGVYWVSRDPR